MKSHAFGFDPFDTLAVVDYGDAALNPHDPSTIAGDIEAHCADILPVGPTLCFGDHFVAYPLLTPTPLHGPLALLQSMRPTHLAFKRSPDWYDVSRAVEEGIIDVERSIRGL